MFDAQRLTFKTVFSDVGPWTLDLVFKPRHCGEMGRQIGHPYILEMRRSVLSRSDVHRQGTETFSRLYIFGHIVDEDRPGKGLGEHLRSRVERRPVRFTGISCTSEMAYPVEKSIDTENLHDPSGMTQGGVGKNQFRKFDGNQEGNEFRIRP